MSNTKNDVRYIDKFELSEKDGFVVLHSPRGSHVKIKDDELHRVSALIDEKLKENKQ